VAQSSDELIKREIADKVGSVKSEFKLRVFPSGSNKDQELFSQGGLTFGVNGVSYGSCDAAWCIEANWVDMNDKREYPIRPILALEGTNALNTGSGGNAQYQRFHHALGAVRNGIIGVYYLRRGTQNIRPELHAMSVAASSIEGTPYIVTDDLELVKTLISSADNQDKFTNKVNEALKKSSLIFDEYFDQRFGDWNTFAKKRSTILIGDTAIKHAGRMKRNFTDGSQRAGHIAVGEMYLTKYLFPKHKVDYLWPRMSRADVLELDNRKSSDKEWALLRSEPHVRIVTREEVSGLEKALRNDLFEMRDEPLKGSAMSAYSRIAMLIQTGLETGKYAIELD